MKNIRLGNYLLENYFFDSEEKVKKYLLTGWVKVNGETVRDYQRFVTGQEKIIVGNPKGRFVSRGGDKLQHALDVFKVSLTPKIAADLGASTGGFTDCLLKAGAEKVYAIDLSYGQFAYSLRNNKRIVLKERTNVKDLKKDDFWEKIDFITVDLSFISILHIFSKIKDIFTPAEGIILLKPQFEAKSNEHENGVVKNKENHRKILQRVIYGLIQKGLFFKDLTFSPLKGPAGNIEFLLYFSLFENTREVDLGIVDRLIEKVVREGYEYLIN